MHFNMIFIVFCFVAISGFAQVVNDHALIALAKAPISSFQYSPSTSSARIFLSAQVHSDHRFNLDHNGEILTSIGELTETQVEWSRGKNAVLISAFSTPNRMLFNGVRDWVEQKILSAEDFRTQLGLNNMPIENSITHGGKTYTLSDSTQMFKMKVSHRFENGLIASLTFPAFGPNNDAGNRFVLELSYFERLELNRNLSLDMMGSIQSKVMSQVLKDLGYSTTSVSSDIHFIFNRRLGNKTRLLIGGSWSGGVTYNTGLPTDYDLYYLNLGFDIGRFKVMLSDNIESEMSLRYNPSYSGLQKGTDFTARVSYTWNL